MYKHSYQICSSSPQIQTHMHRQENCREMLVTD